MLHTMEPSWINSNLQDKAFNFLGCFVAVSMLLGLATETTAEFQGK